MATIVLAEAAEVHARLLASTGEDGYSRAMLAMIRIGAGALAGEYLTGLRYRGRFAAEVEGLLAGRDALLLPTLPCPVPLAGERTVTIAGTRVGVQAALTRLPGPFTARQPGPVLPAGWSRASRSGSRWSGGSAATASCWRWAPWPRPWPRRSAGRPSTRNCPSPGRSG